MRAERLDAMRTDAVALDLETHLIQPGLVAPPPVLGSAAVPRGDKIVGALLDKKSAAAAFDEVYADHRFTLVGANIAYDLLVDAVAKGRAGRDVMPEIFAMFDAGRTIVRGACDGRVFDVQTAEALHAIAQGELGKDPRTGKPIKNKDGRAGRYSLQVVTSQVLARDNAKANDRFRLRYAEFDDVPLDQLPPEARDYPIDDVVNTLEDGLAQAGHRPSSWPHEWRETVEEGRPVTRCLACGDAMTASGPGPDCMRVARRRNLHDLSRQVYAWWALHLTSSWGFKIDQDAVGALEVRYGDTDARRAATAQFVAAGILRESGSENQVALKTMVARAYGAEFACGPCSGTGKVPSPITEGRTKINCAACAGTGYDLPPGVPRTDGDGVGTGRDVLQESGDELLMAYERHGEHDKILTTYVPLLRSARPCLRCGHSGYGKDKHAEGCAGEDGYREVPLIPRPNALVETGRCSYERGIHGLPRKGGVRECIVARPGYVFSSEDFTAGELVTHAQNCIYVVGYSKLAEALNAGLDAHLALAGTMTGRDYAAMLAAKKAGDKRVVDDRQAAKAANFGFPGGMAELTFTVRKRSDPDLFTPCPGGPSSRKGVAGFEGLRTCVLMDGAPTCGREKTTTYKDQPCSPTCVECLKASLRLREFWFRQWPENNPRDGYFAVIKRLVRQVGPSGTAELVHHHSKRIRGGVQFTDGANGLFQGLLADAAKDAYCQITRECYDRSCRVESSEMMSSRYAGLESPLFGSRPILLAHDETIAEHPESVAHDGATRISEIMVESLRWKCPDLKKACKAEPTLMRRLYKGAEPRYARGGEKPADESDHLVCWEPT